MMLQLLKLTFKDPLKQSRPFTDPLIYFENKLIIVFKNKRFPAKTHFKWKLNVTREIEGMSDVSGRTEWNEEPNSKAHYN